MARDKGQSKFSSNFEVKIAEMLDPRLLVDTKEELIKKDTWPSDGNTIYMKEGMYVYVKGDGFYELVSLANILATDYSGWKKAAGGEESQQNIITLPTLSVTTSGSCTKNDYDAIVKAFNNKYILLINNDTGYSICNISFYSQSYYLTFIYSDTSNNTFIKTIRISYDLYIHVNTIIKINDKQDKLVSGTNIKTINGDSVLGSGNIGVQSPLVSGTNIKTINNESILGSGNLSIPNNIYISKILTPTNIHTILDGGVINVENNLVIEELSNAKGKLIVFLDEEETIVAFNFYTSDVDYPVYSFDYCGYSSNGEYVTKTISYNYDSKEFYLEGGVALNRYYVTLSLTTILNGYLTLTQEQFDIIQKCAIKKYPLYIGNTIEGYRKVIYTHAINNIIYLILTYSVNNPINIMLQISMSDYSVSWKYIPNTTIKSLTAGDGGVVTLDPNIYYYLKTSVSYIVITFSNLEMDGMLNEYLFQIDGGITVTLPNTIKWQNEVTPTFEAGYTYEISVINNLACFAEFKTA